MAILNYTTKIGVDKTAQQIQRALVKAKAQAVLSEYEGSVLSRISFRVETPHGILAFQLPANSHGVLLAMQRDSSIPRSYKTKEQADRVAWRILKDWVEAQLAIIEAGLATLPQVFLPYAQTGTGETVYQRFERRGLMALTEAKEGGGE